MCHQSRAALATQAVFCMVAAVILVQQLHALRQGSHFIGALVTKRRTILTTAIPATAISACTSGVRPKSMPSAPAMVAIMASALAHTVLLAYQFLSFMLVSYISSPISRGAFCYRKSYQNE